MLRVLDLGGGVQSSCVAWMAFRGDLPPLNAILFADTGSEAPQTYAYVDRLREEAEACGVEFRVVRNEAKRSVGSLYDDLMGDGPSTRWSAPPFYVRDEHGLGMTMRQCTADYKKDPLHRAHMDLLGLPKGSRGPKEVALEVWLGISLDEKQRMKVADKRWYRYRHPLIEDAHMTRGDCIEYMRKRQLPIPPKSACFFCPYQSDRRWLAMKREQPELWERACALDEHTRALGQFKGKVYLHRSGRPLREVGEELEQRAADAPELDLDMFSDECGGVCGV
jgi:hypothetical protein